MRGLLVVLLVGGLQMGPVHGAWAQSSYVPQHWTIEDGLPVNAVNKIRQGPAGYMWKTTYDGFVRFDGVDFTVYRSSTESVLPSNRFLDLVVGPDDMLWTALESGELVQFDPRTEQFRVFAAASSPLPGSVLGLYRDGEKIWVGTDHGLAYVRNGRIQATPVDTTVSVYHVDAGPDSSLWVGTDRGVFSLQNGDVSRVPMTNGVDLPRVRHLEWTGETLWVASLTGVYEMRDGGLHRLRAEGSSWTRASLYVHQDSRGTLWIGTGGPTPGNLYTYRNGRVRPFAESGFGRGSGVQVGPDGSQWVIANSELYRDEQHILSVDGRIRDLVFDREGNVWVATSRDGVYRLRKSLFTIYGTPEGLESSNIYPIYEDRTDPGTIWIGTLGGGLSRLQGGSVRTYGPANGVPGIVWSLHEDRNGRLWVGSEDDFCYFQNGRCSKRGLPEALASRREVRAIHEDEQGRLWVGTDDHGLYRRDEDSWSHVAPGISARVIVETQNGSLWMGTGGQGLFRYRGGQFEQISTEQGLSSNLVRAIHEDTTGALWIGTENKGVSRIDRRGTPSLADDTIAVVRKRDGLFDDVISQFLPDGQGRFWMSSNRGLFWVRAKDLRAVADGRAERLTSVSYSERDGLRNREANGGMQPAGIRASSGALWFPTQEGAVHIDPDNLNSNRVPPTVAVEHVSADSATIAAVDPVRLEVGQRNFEIKFAGLHFADPTALTFQYQLRGFPEQGIETTNERRVNYTSVPPGRYTFEVRARTQFDEWSEEAATVTLVVPPHWWETWWFIAACGGVFLLLVGGVYRWRTRQLRRRQEELEATVAERTEKVREQRDRLKQQADQLKELDEAKSRFFANISHEFRTPLTLLLGPLEQLRDAAAERGSDEKALIDRMERNVRRLRRLIDQVLDLAELDTHALSMNARPLALAEEVGRLARAFVPMAERQQIELVIETEPASEPDRPVVADPEQLEHIVGNLLSNALKFTPAGGRVAVRTGGNEEEGVIEVADTGPGIPPDQQEAVFDRFEQGEDARSGEGSGIGLAYVQELVDLHGGTIEVESTEGVGTTFVVRLPRGAAPLSEEPVANVSGDEDTTESQKDHPPVPLLVGPQAAPDHGEEERATSASRADDRDRTTVLIVDDNADVRQYVRSVLRPDFRVWTASDGEEGLAAAHKQLPDCILADVMMPEMGGVEMVEALRADRSTECIPVVMLTARATSEDELEGLGAGADDYVTKPFDPEVLQARVRGQIDLQRRLRRRIREELRARSGNGQPPADREAEPSGDSAPGGPPQLVVPAPTDEETTFVASVREAIEDRLADPDLEVAGLAREVGVSRSTLYRRLKEEADCTPTAFIRRVRVQHGARLLRKQEGTISEVAYAVGFNSLTYFSRRFREHFGLSPSDYAEQRA